jgi:hypothetical protein
MDTEQESFQELSPKCPVKTAVNVRPATGRVAENQEAK